MSTKAIRKQLMAAVAMLLVSAIALGSSTFAWFVNNTRVETDSVTVNASTAYALYISKGTEGDSTGWTTTHNFTENTKTAFVPVSTTGKTSVKIDSVSQNQVETPMTFVKSNAWEVNEENDNNNEVKTYLSAAAGTDYFKESFEIKASQACQLAIDMGKTAITAENDTVKATMRMALAVTKKGGTDTKYFFYTFDDGTSSGGANTTLNGTTGADGLEKAVKDGNKSGADAVDAISADNLSENKVKQLSGITGATSSALATLPEGTDSLFTFEANEVCTVDMYVWMEGCDYDTIGTNLTSITGASHTLAVSLGFCAANTGA